MAAVQLLHWLEETEPKVKQLIHDQSYVAEPGFKLSFSKSKFSTFHLALLPLPIWCIRLDQSEPLLRSVYPYYSLHLIYQSTSPLKEGK